MTSHVATAPALDHILPLPVSMKVFGESRERRLCSEQVKALTGNFGLVSDR